MLGYLLGRRPNDELDRRAPRTHRPKAALGMEALEDRSVPAAFYVVPGAAGQTVTLDFSWVGRDAAFNNEIGVYVMDNGTGTVGGRGPSDPGYAQAALSTAAVVFRSGQGQGARNALTFASGTALGFYLVQNGTTDQARAANPANAPGRAGAPTTFFSFAGANADRLDHALVATAANRTTVRFEDMLGGGDRDFNDAVIRFHATATTAVPGAVGQTTPTRFRLNEARGAFRSEIGLYMFDDLAGTVGGVRATDPGYAAAVLRSASRQVLFPRGAGAGATSTVNLPGAGTFGLYLIQNATAETFLAQNPQNRVGGGPLTFFSFSPANPDAVEHVRKNPNTMFFEDGTRAGDQDFNDAVVTFEYLPTVGAPAAAAPPASPPAAPPTVPPPPAAPGDTTAPAVTAALTTDTADNTRPETQTDRVTSALGVSGTVADASAITALEARLGTTGAFASVLPSLTGTTYAITAAQLQALNGGVALPDGTYTVQVRATDAAGNTSAPAALTFTLATSAPASLLLAAASDTGTQGEFRTETTGVTLTGTTTPFAQVVLESQAVTTNPGGPPIRVELGRTTADAGGQFAFANQTLAAGPNGFRAVVRDGAGNANTAGATVTRNRAPAANAPTSGVAGTAGGTATQNLNAIFSDADTNTYVRFTVNQPTGPTTVDVQLFNSVTPGHATNFLAYANADDYDSTIIHRSATLTGGTPFVIQGGGFEFVGGNPNIVNVATRPNVTNEPGLPNSKGTVALAKGNGVSTGNSQFFFNLNDNTAGGPALDSQNGGFTVFGQVVGAGQAVIDALAAVPVRDFSGGNTNSPFGTVPIRANPNNTPPINTLQDAQANNLVLFSDVSALANPLTYTITANSNTAVVTNAVGSVVPANGQLALNFGVAGTASVTVTATDPDGATATHTFTVTVT